MLLTLMKGKEMSWLIIVAEDIEYNKKPATNCSLIANAQTPSNKETSTGETTTSRAALNVLCPFF